MRLIEPAVLVALVLILGTCITLMVASLMGWTFVHNKLRFERKEDAKQARRR